MLHFALSRATYSLIHAVIKTYDLIGISMQFSTRKYTKVWKFIKKRHVWCSIRSGCQFDSGFPIKVGSKHGIAIIIPTLTMLWLCIFQTTARALILLERRLSQITMLTVFNNFEAVLLYLYM